MESESTSPAVKVKPPAKPLTALGKILLGVSLLPAIVVIFIVVGAGIPIPFTGLVLHSVLAGVIVGLVVLFVINATLSWMFGLFGMKTFVEPNPTELRPNPYSDEALRKPSRPT